MLSKIFKKTETPPPTAPVPKQPAAPTPAQIAAQLADKAEWESKLLAATGDDITLLSIAKESPLIDIKQAAVEALTSEDALKRAEREFRDHDRRVHRAAKQRYETLVNRRLASVNAAKLIETGSVLLHEPSIPANRLVELDRAWAALDANLLEEKQVATYTALWTKLSQLTRERGEHQLQVKRWLADAEPALSKLMVACAEVAEGSGEHAALLEARAKAEAVAATAPGEPTSTPPTQVATKLAALTEALQVAVAIDVRLAFLDAIQQPPVVVATPDAALAVAPASAEDTASTTAPATTPTIAQENVEAPRETPPPQPGPPSPPSPAARWRALPPVADAHIAALLDTRFAQWQTSKSDARQARSVEARQHAKAESTAARQARSDALAVAVTALVEKAELALADGHVGECTKYLTAIDEATSNTKGAVLDKPLQTRIETLQGETARLKGWQHWGGGRVRDDLAVEAETLAKASTAEKIAIKQHADAIENLRNRWRELDKLGGATSRPLWQRFDGALKTAYAPVAVHLAKLKAVRQENLAARNALLDALDAVKISGPVIEASPPSDPVAGAESATEPIAAPAPAPAAPPAPAPIAAPGTSPDWRALARALEHFQTEWRKLGPVEHTVPHKAQAPLSARMKASIARLDEPLSEARRIAQLERERLIARATALAADIKSRDVITKVRQLQSEWQAHAKTLPLMRQVENALWTQFKTATDAVFTQRDEIHSARDAEFKANQSAREALIARLAGLGADTPGGEIKRTLNDVDTEWRKCGEVPRAEAAKLEAAFRAARDSAQQYLAGSAKRGWHNICDALNAKMALCTEAESAHAPAEVAARWAALPVLPTAWEKALSARLTNAQNGAASEAAADDASEEDAEEAAEEFAQKLLQLESALEIESPPAFQSARRDLKLRAMKAAIEGRQSATVTNGDIERWLGEVIAKTSIDANSNSRMATILAALRNKPLR